MKKIEQIGTVQDMIEALQKLDPKMPVLVHCNEDWSCNGFVCGVGTPKELESTFYCASLKFSEELEPQTEYLVIKGYSGGD